MTAMFNSQPVIGPQGENGATFTPSVSAEGDLSWTNDKGLPNPEPVNIKGPQGEQGPVGSRGEDVSSVYSTEETRIGTWIDGKPIYRKVINAMTPSAIGSSTAIYNLPGINLINAHGFVIRSGRDVDMAPSANVGFSYLSNKVMISIGHDFYANRSIYVVIEYTKTTDAATVSQVNLLSSEVNSPDVPSPVSYAPASASSAKLNL